MTLRHVGIPAGEMSELTEAGWNESFDKLAESLAKGVSPTMFTSDHRVEAIVVMRCHVRLSTRSKISEP